VVVEVLESSVLTFQTNAAVASNKLWERTDRLKNVTEESSNLFSSLGAICEGQNMSIMTFNFDW